MSISRRDVPKVSLCLFLTLALSCAGPEPLVELGDEAPGENCGEGGVWISEGMDENGDGSLDPDEIESTAYVCNGQNGQDGEDGLDGEDGADGEDGVDGEDGADGQDGADGEDGLDGGGPQTLVELSEEPSGENCEEGGVALSSGVDGDSSGTLEPEEVESVVYVCNGADGDDGEDGQGGGGGVSGITRIEGSIIISTIFELALLTELEEVTGSLTIYPDASVATVSLPKLKVIGGSFGMSRYDSEVVELHLPSLESVAGAFTLRDQRKLEVLDIWPGMEVGGRFEAELDGVSSPSLEFTLLGAEYVRVTGVGAERLTLNLPTEVGTINIEGSAGLKEVALGGDVQTATEWVIITSSEDSTLETLTGLESLSRVDEDLTLKLGAAITEPLNMGALTSVGSQLTLWGGQALFLPSAFPELISVDAGIQLKCDPCEEIAGFGGALSVSSLSIVDSSASRLNLLPNATSVGDLSIMGLPNLTSVAEMPSLTILGHLLLADLPRLDSISTLPIPSGGNLTLERVDQLRDLEGLEQTQWLNSLRLLENANLTSLAGIDGLRNVTSEISIERNPSLSDITALSGVENGPAYRLSVMDNPQLQQCQVDSVFADASASSITISGNNESVCDL